MDSATINPHIVRANELAAFLGTLQPGDRYEQAEQILRFLEDFDRGNEPPVNAQRISKVLTDRALESGRTYLLTLPPGAEPFAVALTQSNAIQLWFRYVDFGPGYRGNSLPTHHIKVVCAGGPTITDEDTHLQSLVHLGSLLHIFVGPVR